MQTLGKFTPTYKLFSGTSSSTREKYRLHYWENILCDTDVEVSSDWGTHLHVLYYIIKGLRLNFLQKRHRKKKERKQNCSSENPLQLRTWKRKNQNKQTNRQINKKHLYSWESNNDSCWVQIYGITGSLGGSSSTPYLRTIPSPTPVPVPKAKCLHKTKA